MEGGGNCCLEVMYERRIKQNKSDLNICRRKLCSTILLLLDLLCHENSVDCRDHRGLSK